MEDEYCPYCETYGQHSNYQCHKNLERIIKNLEKEREKILQVINDSNK